MKTLNIIFFILLHMIVIGFCIFAYITFIQPLFFHNSPSERVLGAMTTNAQSSHSLTPVVSNQWFSAIYKTFPTAPLYAIPLVYKISHEGIGFSYPTVKTSTDEITAPYTQDFSVGTQNEINGVKPISIGDWSVKLEMQTQGNNYLDAFIGHGIPFATLDTNENKILINLTHPFTLSDGTLPITQQSIQISDFLITTNTDSYIVAFDTPVTITQKSNQIILQNPKHIFIGLLDSPEHYSLFKQIATIRILDTQSYPSINTTTVNIQYKLNNNGIIPLIALYPHQFDNLASKISVIGQYQTIRGSLRLVKTDNFTTATPLIVPPQTYQNVTKNYPDLHTAIKQDIENIIKNGKAPGNDYYLGTWYGQIADLLQLADTLGEKEEENKLLQYIEPLFYQSLQNFYYDKNKTSFIAKYPEFGNENLSDHHFHYGYYIRLAAVLASLDLPSLQHTQSVIHEMATDIATANKNESNYPFLRNFDIYESHSWADGYAVNDMGNNQESTSEAINAWYALYLWSQVTNDETLRQTSLYLYNAEILGTTYYWFNATNIYKSPYAHAIASRVWGGKIDFQTWFSNQTNMKYGIQLLPITPGSIYLKHMQLSNEGKYFNDFKQSGGSIHDSWGDLMLMLASYYTPQQALQEKDTVTHPEQANPHANFLYFLYKNSE
ncbi:MAG TPA: glycosyl hydrolase [Candidatus Sulfotelmatobacter sp.]|jgi:endoglucanase Acf2|nr:glycosyl hydrolase [Candidatus Sulfotelmatobacter sp.]